MRKISLILLFIILIGAAFNICNASEKNEKPSPKVNQLIDKLQSDLQLVKEALQEVRRDQLNYSIAKDLLKDTYSSNIQTINIVIAIILGVFTIIGFLGIKSISAIRKEFREELSELRRLREKYEKKFIEIETEQDRTNDKFEELQNTNEEQNRRLQVLEIQEKIGTLLKNKNYNRAMEYITVGLGIEPHDVTILKQKAECLISLSRFPEAIQCSKVLLEIEPDGLVTIVNLAELYLATGDIPEAETLIGKHKKAIIEKDSNLLLWYFDLIKLYRMKDLDAIRLHIDDEIIQTSEGNVKRIEGWNFLDVRKIFEKDEATPLKTLFLKCIDFLDGKADVSALNEIKSEKAV